MSLRVVWQFAVPEDIWQVRLLMWHTMQRKQALCRCHLQKITSLIKLMITGGVMDAEVVGERGRSTYASRV